MPGGEEKASGHVPALDGIRGVAILSVLLFHFTVFSHMPVETFADRAYRGLFAAGWSGVDLFFVLSGFLITGILLDTRDDPRYLRNFYARRFLRIFPLYYAAVLGLLFALPLALPRIAERSSVIDALWYLSYTSNIRDAFGGWSNPFVGHFWSLAIEEQFYLVWPMAILWFRRSAIPFVCGVLLVAAPVLRTLLVLQSHPLAAYALTPCRVDALAAGALVAWMVRSERHRAWLASWSRLAILVSAGLLACLAAARHGIHTEDPVIATAGFSLIAYMYSALVAATFVAPEHALLKRLFEIKPLRVLGKYSYGLYVFHQPVAAYMERAGLVFPRLPLVGGSVIVTEMLLTVAGGGVAFVLAFASWHLFEVHFLRLKRYFNSVSKDSSPRSPASGDRYQPVSVAPSPPQSRY